MSDTVKTVSAIAEAVKDLQATVSGYEGVIASKKDGLVKLINEAKDVIMTIQADVNLANDALTPVVKSVVAKVEADVKALPTEALAAANAAKAEARKLLARVVAVGGPIAAAAGAALAHFL